MDTRITKERYKAHLEYDWFKYLLIILCAVLFFTLIYTMTSPKLSPSEEFEILIHTYYYDNKKLDEIKGELLNVMSSGNNDVKNVAFYCYTNNDINSMDVIYSDVEYEYRIMYDYPDVTIVPTLSTHIEQDGDGNYHYVFLHGYSFEYLASYDKYIPIDEFLTAQINAGNTLAKSVYDRLIENDLLFSLRRVEYPNDASAECVYIDDEAKYWGIDLNKFNLDKLETLITDGKPNSFNYVLGIMKATENPAEVVIFLDFMITNYA